MHRTVIPACSHRKHYYYRLKPLYLANTNLGNAHQKNRAAVARAVALLRVHQPTRAKGPSISICMVSKMMSWILLLVVSRTHLLIRLLSLPYPRCRVSSLPKIVFNFHILRSSELIYIFFACLYIYSNLS